MARTPKPWFDKERKVWKVTINGRRHNLGKNKKLAMEEFHRLMLQPAAKKVPSQSLPGIIDAFLDWVHKHRAPDTYEWYRYRLQRFIDHHRDLRVQDLRPFHVETWIDSYESLSQTSRRNYIRSIKRCLSWAKKQGYIETNPVESLEAPSAERREVFVSLEDFNSLLSYIRDETLRDLVTTTWLVGCRPQESLRVEGRHVDAENQRWVFPIKESKGKKLPRIVYLTDEAMAITKRHMLRHPTGTIFRNRNGRPWTPDAVNCAFDRIQIRMGKAEIEKRNVSVSNNEIAAFVPLLSPTKRSKGEVVQKTATELRSEAKRKLTNRLAASLAPRYSPYSLRHAWATHALQKGLDSTTVAVLMGHSDVSTLARVYQHLSHSPDYLLEQAKRASKV